MPVRPRWLRLDSRLLWVGSLKSILQIALDEVAGGGLDLHLAVVSLVPALHLLADGEGGQSGPERLVFSRYGMLIQDPIACAAATAATAQSYRRKVELTQHSVHLSCSI